MATHDKEYSLHKISTEMSQNKQQQVQQTVTPGTEKNLIFRVATSVY